MSYFTAMLHVSC